MSKTIHRSEYEVLRQCLRAHRVEAGITQTQLSQQLGRSQSFVSDVERGVRRLDLLELRDICELIGQDLVTFVQEFEAKLASRGRKPPAKRK